MTIFIVIRTVSSSASYQYFNPHRQYHQNAHVYCMMIMRQAYAVPVWSAYSVAITHSILTDGTTT